MQTLKVFLSLLLCSITQVSCSPLYHEPAENNIKHSLTNPEDGSYEIIWEKTDTQMFDNRNNSMIVISQGVVFLEGASTENSELYLFSLDAVTGAEIWRREVSSSPAQLLVTGTMLFRGTGGAGHLQAYDTSTGQLLWNTALPRTHTVVKLYSYDENIFVNTNDDAIGWMISDP